MPTNNPLTEVGTLVIAALLIIGGVILLYVSKIDTAFATSMFILAAGLLGLLHQPTTLRPFMRKSDALA